MRIALAPAVLSLGLASTALAGPGQLDPSFGTGGKVTLDFGGTVAVARAVALQPDGKIVVVGQGQTSATPASADFAVARFTAAGQLDATFGVGGKVTTDFFGAADGANAVALQPDGKILVGGFAGGSFALARYHANGQLDMSFGTGGKVMTSSAPNPYPHPEVNPDFPCQPLGSTALMGLYEITAVAVQPDGRIVAGGNAVDISMGNQLDVNVALVRYQPDGSPDPSLLANTNPGCAGVNGIRIDNVSSINVRDYLNSLLILPDGKILVGGSTEHFKSGQSHEWDSLLIRYQSSGVPDSTFGDSSTCPSNSVYTCVGVVVADTHYVYGYPDNIAALALQPDGKVTSVGAAVWASYPSGLDWSVSFALTRHRPDGTLDETFGYSSGITNQLLPPEAPPHSGGYGGTGIALDAGGRIVAVGGTSTPTIPNPSGSPRNFAVARFGASGLLDGVFNGTGFVQTDFFGFEDAALGVAVQPDGRIVAVGFANTSETTSKMAIARYEGGGACTYSANLSFIYYQAAAGFGYMNLDTAPGCPWTVTTTAPWIHVTVASGAGARTFTPVFTIDPNGGQARTGTVMIAGIALSFTQAGTTAAPPEDLVVDFGAGYGIWVQRGTAWSQLHASDPEAMTRGDLDGNGVDDLVVDFGPAGVWNWMNRAAWVRLSPLSPAAMITADLDGNGRDEVVLSFTGAGTWIWWNNATWLQLHPMNPTLMTRADLDNSGQDELVLDFPGYGIWIYANGTSWVQLHTLNAGSILAADLDSNQRDDLVIQFPGYGVWRYSNNATWSQLHTADAVRVAAGDLDANGVSDLAIDFGAPYGVWTLSNNSTWAPLHPLLTRSIVMVDRDGDRRDEIIIDFGATYGVWQYSNGAWTLMHARSPDGMVEGRFH